uniref:Reverse transcriptase domain-containing protein n=1 Tax=Cacopsylla melanoneura TaxID=428564 RepID=A0A8D8VD09_9HEMI
MYADDALLCYATNNWTDTYNKAEQDLTNVAMWYTNMCLKINLMKSNYMTFSANKTGQPTNMTLTIHDRLTNTDQTLTKVTCTRYLGVILDQHLRFKEHVNYINKKIRYLMYIFNSLKNICSQRIIRMIYFGLAQSLIQYCLVIWGGSYQNVIDPLRRTQNILLRIILKKDRMTHAKILYDTFKVPPLTDLYIYKLLFFSVKHAEKWTFPVHAHNTRQKHHTQITRTNLSLIRTHFIYLGEQAYNILPAEIKMINNKNSLKSALKKFLENVENKNKVIEIIN